jgi:hypothetical protein
MNMATFGEIDVDRARFGLSIMRATATNEEEKLIEFAKRKHFIKYFINFLHAHFTRSHSYVN